MCSVQWVRTFRPREVKLKGRENRETRRARLAIHKAVLPLHQPPVTQSDRLRGPGGASKNQSCRSTGH